MKVIDGIKERFVAVTIGGNIPVDSTFTLILMPSGQKDVETKGDLYDSAQLIICDKHNTMQNLVMAVRVSEDEVACTRLVDTNAAAFEAEYD